MSVPRLNLSNNKANPPTWNIHVWAVDIVTGWQIPPILPIGSNHLLAQPALVPPGKQHQEELVEDI